MLDLLDAVAGLCELVDAAGWAGSLARGAWRMARRLVS